jgi:hypothetical protein
MYSQEVNLDKATVLTTIFTIVDDAMKASPKIQAALRRRGPRPCLSDSEAVTIALYQELIGEPREDHFFRLHAEGLREYFPGLNERSRYNRRKRDLWSVILAVRMALLIALGASEADTTVIDSAPTPCVGYKRSKLVTDFAGSSNYGVCSSKAMKYFGVKLHNLVTLTGVILDFMLTSAAPHDSQPVMEFLEQHQDKLIEVLGDKAYNGELLQSMVKEELGIQLTAPGKVNQPKRGTKAERQCYARWRLVAERANSQLQEQFHLSKHYAKSKWGLMTRVAAKLTAHTIGILVNKIWGRPPLALAGLGV